MAWTANPIVLIEGSTKEEALIRQAMIESKLGRLRLVRRSVEDALAYLAMAEANADSVMHPLPGLVILSLKSSRGDGLEVIEWLKSQPKLAQTPVVALAPVDAPAAWRRLHKSKVALILPKPVVPEHLNKAVAEHYRLPTPGAAGRRTV